MDSHKDNQGRNRGGKGSKSGTPQEPVGSDSVVANSEIGTGIDLVAGEVVQPLPVPVPSEASSSLSSVEAAEIGTLAYQMAQSYRGMVEHYRNSYKYDPDAADAEARKMLAPNTAYPEYEENIRHGPPQESSWWQLNHLAENDPDAAMTRWQNIKQAARDELASGHQAIEAIQGPFDKPWSRAQFLAVRQSLIDGWQPTNAIEQALIDMMAQAQSMCQMWLKQLITYMECEIVEQTTKYDKEGYHVPPRVHHYNATEQAAAMVDRFNRLYLRTLRQLRDLRRYAPQVTIQNAGQVNIASGQQMNLAKIAPTEQANLSLE